MPSDALSLFPNQTLVRSHELSSEQPAQPARAASPVTDHPYPTKAEPLRGLALHLGARHTGAVLLEPARRQQNQFLLSESQASPPEISATALQAAEVSSSTVRSSSETLWNTQSLFPEYNHAIPLAQQNYYPTAEAPKLQRRSTSAARRPSLRLQTTDTLQDPGAPIAGIPVLETLWHAATGSPHNKRAKNVQLAMHGDTESTFGKSGADLEIGFSDFYHFTRKSLKPSRAQNMAAEVLVRRQHPSQDISVPIAALDIVQPSLNDEEPPNDRFVATTIFPQTAAIAALEAASRSPHALSISQYDPHAASPQAAQLAFAAVAEAKQAEQCHIMCTRQTNEPRSLENQYSLHHPRLGEFVLEIDGDINLPAETMLVSSRRSGRGRSHDTITIYRPASSSVSSCDHATYRQALATLDLTAGILDISLEVLGTLKSRYILDTAVCALMAVAFIESDKPRRHDRFDRPYFLGPPHLVSKQRRHMEPGAGRWSRIKTWRNSFKREEKVRGDVEKPLPPLPSEIETEHEKIPFVTRALLKLLGLSFEAIVWLLSLGFQALAKVLVGIGKALG